MEQKKLHILKNVGKLYLRYGIRSVTMDDIAAEFGISKKTLYQFFNDKEDLVTQVITYYMENPVFNLNDLSGGNAIDRIFALRDHVARVLKNFNNSLEYDLKRLYPALHKQLHEFKFRKIYNDTIRNIEDGKKQGLFREEIDPGFIARLQVGRMLLTFNPESGIFSETEAVSMELFDKSIDYHLHGICTPEGLKYYKEQLKKFQNETQE